MAKERYNEAKTSIERTGVYHLTKEELEYGVKQAWRNAPRCPGRIQWKNLVLRDYRSISNYSVLNNFGGAVVSRYADTLGTSRN